MPTFVTLYKWTEQGIKNVRDAPARMEAGKKAAEALGAKIIASYFTSGEYDAVTISEWPSEEAGLAALFTQAMQGNVRSTTMRAFSAAEITQVLSKIPK
jgi:uncharacterized protein with GYD domain